MAGIRNLPALVRERFNLAQQTGDLTFYATRVAILQCEGLPFQLRFSPALANKPKPKPNKPRSPTSKPFDPFEDPQPGLLITALPPAHIIILNKFPVIPDHFILATKDFKQQTELLEKEDLEAAYACLNAYKEKGEKLFGFFNSGEHSGASQSHRHLQFLPVESMKSGIEMGSEWSVLADALIEDPKPALPFSYFSAMLPECPTAGDLHRIYLALHNQACHAVGVSGVTTGTKPESSLISYNLGLTDRAIVLCPRTSEGLNIKNNAGESIGPIALNGTIVGGTLLVKSEKEWDALRNDDNKLTHILQAIGIPPAPESEGH
ncbi:ATP adenylyltransferase, partial [Diplocarpon rosae]